MARADAGWSREEFRRSNPRVLFRVLDRLREAEIARDKCSDFRAGQVAAVIANVNRGKHGRTYEPTDFFPSIAGPKQEMTDEQLWDMAVIMNAAFGGVDHTAQ